MGVNGIYGLSGSGLDVESMVKVGMLSKQNQYDKMQQTYTKNEWTKEAYLEIYDKIQDYSLNTLSNYKLSSYMNARSATSSNPIIKATADSSAPVRNHTITVESTATSAYLVGTQSLERGDKAENAKSTKLSDLLFASWDSETTGTGADATTIYRFYSWVEDVDSDGTSTYSKSNTPTTTIPVTAANSDTALKDSAMKFTIGDGAGAGVRSEDESIVKVKTNDAYSNTATSATYTVKITSTGTYSTASFTHTSLSDSNTPYELLADAFGWDSLDSVSISDGQVTFSGTSSSPYGDIYPDKPYDIDETALEFEFAIGSNVLPSVEITYGDLAKVLTDSNATFQDFADLLNKKLAENDIDLTASYDADNRGFKISTNVASTETVTANLNPSGGLSGSLIAFLGGSGGLGATLSTNESTTGVAAKGTIKKDNGTTKEVDFDGTGGTYTQDGIVFTAGALGKTTVTAKPEKTVNISYQDIIDGASYYDLVSKINNTGTNVRANYDAMQDKFSIYNMKTGTSNNITLTTRNIDTTNFFNRLGLKDYAESDDLTEVDPIKFETDKNQSVTGGNAAVWVDHQKYENIDSNNLKVQGVTYNFANVTEKTTATITVEQDVDKIIDNVQGFVDSYNELLNDLYTKYRETPNSSYAPLTEAQKNEMTEEQIKKWEEKAKSGLLYHDSTVRRIIEQMRNAISDSVSSLDDDYKYDSAYSIGISTTGLYGQLKLDKDKLRDALNDDPDSVYKVFATLDSKKEDASDAANGIAQRLGGIMTNAVKSISNVAGTSSDTSDDSKLSVLLRNLQTKMSNFQTMMNAFETQLYKKYDAMESALAMLGTQLNYVTSAFSG